MRTGEENREPGDDRHNAGDYPEDAAASPAESPLPVPMPPGSPDPASTAERKARPAHQDQVRDCEDDPEKRREPVAIVQLWLDAVRDRVRGGLTWTLCHYRDIVRPITLRETPSSP